MVEKLDKGVKGQLAPIIISDLGLRIWPPCFGPLIPTSSMTGGNFTTMKTQPWGEISLTAIDKWYVIKLEELKPLNFSFGETIRDPLGHKTPSIWDIKLQIFGADGSSLGPKKLHKNSTLLVSKSMERSKIYDGPWFW